ncbi:MAG: hypothetical protein ACREUX_07525 [Burkholderiales bacterium]
MSAWQPAAEGGMPGERGGEAAIERACVAMQAELNALREAISRELCTIPPPVPACDVNFNRLLEDRARVTDELQTLARLRTSQAGRDQLVAFCRASSALDARGKAQIEAILLGAVAEN